jgi:hypothetical protein
MKRTGIGARLPSLAHSNAFPVGAISPFGIRRPEFDQHGIANADRDDLVGLVGNRDSQRGEIAARGLLAVERCRGRRTVAMTPSQSLSPSNRM